MPDKDAGSAYLIDSDDEMTRLERQAAIYGTSDDLAHLALRPTDNVLDAGCGAGAITRTIARAVAQGHATGLDRESRYIEYAAQRALADGISNIAFHTGHVTELPFEAARFDVVWSKHLLSG
ncbi:MAG: class I SAM-dependent methyltransferase [Burkholderiaceae bacterium]